MTTVWQTFNSHIPTDWPSCEMRSDDFEYDLRQASVLGLRGPLQPHLEESGPKKDTDEREFCHK